jgi:predicted enzyme related to lactoylglutathione lyase
MPKKSVSNFGLSLLVIRSGNIDKAAEFYKALGLTLKKHSHPPCGEHYSSDGTGCVFEICQREQDEPTTPIVLGFEVSRIDAAVQAAVAKGGVLKAPSKDSVWGRFAVVKDLDGNSVFLTQKELVKGNGLPPTAAKRTFP